MLGVNRHLGRLWPNGELFVHLDDGLGKDIYKNHVCILTSFFEIISELMYIRVDGVVFPISFKEAPGWNPSFSSGFRKNDMGVDKDQILIEEGGSNFSLHDKDECSDDPCNSPKFR